MMNGKQHTSIILPRDLYFRVLAIKKKTGGGLSDFFRDAVEERVRRVEKEMAEDEARKRENQKRQRGPGDKRFSLRRRAVGDALPSLIDRETPPPAVVTSLQGRFEALYLRTAKRVLAAGADKEAIKTVLREATAEVKKIMPLRPPSDEDVVRSVERAIDSIQLGEADGNRVNDNRVGQVIDTKKIRTWGDRPDDGDGVEDNDDEPDYEDD